MGADRITAGPLTAAGNNPFDVQALVLDALNGILEMSGNDHVMRGVQTMNFMLNAQAALSAITTAQNLINRSFNPGALNKISRTLVVEGQFIYTTPGTTTPTITIALVLGGVTLCSVTTAALSATASANMPVQFYFTLSVVSTGAAATIEAHGNLNANISANTPAAAVSQFVDTNTAVSAAVNLAAATTLQLTIAASSVITSVQLRQALGLMVN
jgi:hypothetical protein